jgi:hypothetical protein
MIETEIKALLKGFESAILSGELTGMDKFELYDYMHAQIREIYTRLDF